MDRVVLGERADFFEEEGGCCRMCFGRQLLTAGGVLEFAGGGYRKGLWNRDVDVKTAELAVKFALVQVGNGMPAFAVIDGRLGIPLGDLVSVADVPAPGKVKRELFVERGGDEGCLTRREGMRKVDLYDVDVTGMIFHACSFSVHAEIKPIDIAFFVLIGKVELCVAIGKHLFAEGGLIILVSVGPAMDPDPGEGIRGMIGVSHFYEAVQGMFHIIKADFNDVVDLLLPVFLSWKL